jgi:molybdopterin-binding protein
LGSVLQAAPRCGLSANGDESQARRAWLCAGRFPTTRGRFPPGPSDRGATTAHVEIEVGGTVVTAFITNEAVDEMKLARGMKTYAVIKASDVMICID